MHAFFTCFKMKSGGLGLSFDDNSDVRKSHDSDLFHRSLDAPDNLSPSFTDNFLSRTSFTEPRDISKI
jgi:hypothetical protein